MINWPNLLLIAGTGRKVGKTTLVCKLIEQFVQSGQPVAAIKLTPHFHQVCPDCILLLQAPGILILEEKSNSSGKDSARMVKAGAHPVYFVQANDDALPQVIHFLKKRISENAVIICESAGMRKQVNPGYFIMIQSDEINAKNLDLISLADIVVKPFDFKKIQPGFTKGCWTNVVNPAVNHILI